MTIIMGRVSMLFRVMILNVLKTDFEEVKVSASLTED